MCASVYGLVYDVHASACCALGGYMEVTFSVFSAFCFLARMWGGGSWGGHTSSERRTTHQLLTLLACVFVFSFNAFKILISVRVCLDVVCGFSGGARFVR